MGACCVGKIFSSLLQCSESICWDYVRGCFSYFTLNKNDSPLDIDDKFELGKAESQREASSDSNCKIRPRFFRCQRNAISWHWRPFLKSKISLRPNVDGYRYTLCSSSTNICRLSTHDPTQVRLQISKFTFQSKFSPLRLWFWELREFSRIGTWNIWFAQTIYHHRFKSRVTFVRTSSVDDEQSCCMM